MRSKKVVGDALWSYMAFAIMALSGVALNFTLGMTRGAEAVGVFNQTMAFYVIASHFAVFGMHNSVLYFCSAYPRHANTILRKAILPVFFVASAVSAAGFIFAPFIARALESPNLVLSLQLASLALLFFAFNKVVLAYLNSGLRMKVYAIAQSLRYLIILVCIIYICFEDIALSFLGITFLISEVVVSSFLLFLLARYKVFRTLQGPSDLRKMLIRFSYRSAGAGLLNEINLRIDVLVLGFFMSDQVVGLYSFAAIFVEGFYNVGLVIRNILNPYLVKAIKSGSYSDLEYFVKRMHPFNLIVSLTIFACVYFLYDPIIVDLLNMKDFAHAKDIIVVLFLFMSVYFLFIPFEEIVLISGRPLVHTAIYLGVISFNLLFNIVLIPQYGVMGAALSTGSAFIIMLISVTIYCRQKLRISLICGTKIRK